MPGESTRIAREGLRRAASFRRRRRILKHGRNFVNDFGDSEDRDFFGVDDEFDASFAHARAAHSEDFRAGSLAEAPWQAAPRTCRQMLRRRRSGSVAASLEIQRVALSKREDQSFAG